MGNSCVVLLLAAILQACGSTQHLYQLPAITDTNTVNSVIEIPGGTNKKYEYNAASGDFEIDRNNNKDRVIDFLPYPSNYGFIPSTLSDAKEGGDGDALDVLVISESLETGTIITSIPVAVLKLMDAGEEDYKIIAVPANAEQRIISALTYDQLVQSYPGLIHILETWFLNYNREDPASIKGWGDEKEAMEVIKEQLKK